MFCTEQIRSPEFCGSRVPRTPLLVGRESGKSVGFGTREIQVGILVLTLASWVCLTFEKSYISWSLCKVGEQLYCGIWGKLNVMLGIRPLE